MNNQNSFSFAGKLTVVSLMVAAVGVVIQMVSGHDYPTLPPVFFILLIPAGLTAFGHWRWAPLSAVLAGLFLTFGLFASGESARLFSLSKFGDSIGLWVQMLAVILATICGVIATVQNYRSPRSAIGSTL